jgi:hypothetical protein
MKPDTSKKEELIKKMMLRHLQRIKEKWQMYQTVKKDTIKNE